MASPARPDLQLPELRLIVNGEPVTVVDDGASLLEVLRDRLGLTSPKDGCSPQGQCGCCTILVDGQPRVSCVTPARRVQDREVTTLEGLAPDVQAKWAEAFAAAGASQCGFCTPGIICRFEGMRARGEGVDAGGAASKALQAHLCRCTGWLPIIEAWTRYDGAPVSVSSQASHRAELEGATPQMVGPAVALGQGGFADDSAPPGALVAVLDGQGEWVVGETLSDARAQSSKVQGRRTTEVWDPPIEVPSGDWDFVLQTGWTEPAYLETDASWCEPGGEPSSPLANGGAFGAKLNTEVATVARQLADRHGRPVRVLYSREDVTRRGPKRPPLAAGMNTDGTGVIHVVATPGIAESIAAVAPGLEIHQMNRAGPPTSASIRGAGWAEVHALLAASRGEVGWVTSPTPHSGAATARVTSDETIHITVRPGLVLDETVVRSYCIGAAHMALSWVTSESLAVSPDGEVHDLTVRSFGVLRAADMVPVEVSIEASDEPPVAVAESVFAAVAAAVWLHQGTPPVWPTRRLLRSPS